MRLGGPIAHDSERPPLFPLLLDDRAKSFSHRILYSLQILYCLACKFEVVAYSRSPAVVEQFDVAEQIKRLEQRLIERKRDCEALRQHTTKGIRQFDGARSIGFKQAHHN